jgi:hypothetical protein
VGGAEQPRAEGRRPADGLRVAHEDDEGGLEGVLGVGLIRQDLAAGGQDAGPVPADDGLERGVVAVAAEPDEQVGVREVGEVVGGQGVGEVADQAGEGLGRHGRASGGTAAPDSVTPTGRRPQQFFGGLPHQLRRQEGVQLLPRRLADIEALFEVVPLE